MILLSVPFEDSLSEDATKVVMLDRVQSISFDAEAEGFTLNFGQDFVTLRVDDDFVRNFEVSAMSMGAFIHALSLDESGRYRVYSIYKFITLYSIFLETYRSDTGQYTLKSDTGGILEISQEVLPRELYG